MGASQIELDQRGKVLEKWKKRHRASHEMLEKWNSVHKSSLTYPKLIEKAFEEKAEHFAAKVGNSRPFVRLNSAFNCKDTLSHMYLVNIRTQTPRLMNY